MTSVTELTCPHCSASLPGYGQYGAAVKHGYCANCKPKSDGTENTCTNCGAELTRPQWLAMRRWGKCSHCNPSSSPKQAPQVLKVQKSAPASAPDKDIREMLQRIDSRLAKLNAINITSEVIDRVLTRKEQRTPRYILHNDATQRLYLRLVRALEADEETLRSEVSAVADALGGLIQW